MMIYDLGFCQNCGSELREDDNNLCEECEIAEKAGLPVDYYYCSRCGAELEEGDVYLDYHPVAGKHATGYKCHQCGFLFVP